MMWLALCGAIEAVVYQFRYRSAVVGRPIVAAGWAGLLAVLRVIWTVLGVSAWMSGGTVWRVCLVYGVPVALATWAASWWSDRQLRKLRPFDLCDAIAEKHTSSSRIGPSHTEATHSRTVPPTHERPQGTPPPPPVHPRTSRTEVRP